MFKKHNKSSLWWQFWSYSTTFLKCSPGPRLKKILRRDVRPKYRIILWPKVKAIISNIMVLDLQTVPSWNLTFLFPIPLGDTQCSCIFSELLLATVAFWCLLDLWPLPLQQSSTKQINNSHWVATLSTHHGNSRVVYLSWQCPHIPGQRRSKVISIFI